VRFAFIGEHRTCWPVTLMCRVLAVSRSGFYGWLNRKPGPRQQRREQLTQKIRQVHEDSRQTYGSPRVHRALREQKEQVSPKTVAKIMKTAGIQGKTRRKYRPRTTDSDHTLPIAANLLQRDFTAAAPNRKWVADITYIATAEGWLYLAVVMDLFSRMIVGWSMADHLKASLVCDALKMAVARRRPAAGLIHHSDRGVQYASDAFAQLLAEHGITASMSGKGDCYDNAAMESFFGTMKTELPDEVFAGHALARSAIFDYIEVFYNRQRLHSTLDYVSPATFEQRHQVA